MEIWKIGEAVFIISVMAVLCWMEKKDPERTRSVLANTFVWTMGAAVPFALIELLSALGVSLFDVPWTIGPLDAMGTIALIALLVLSGKKLFSIIPAKG